MPRASKRKRRSFQLAKQNLDLIFDNLPDPIFVTDCYGNVLLSNSTTALTLDMSLDQLLKSNIHDLVAKNYYSKSYAVEAAEKKCVVQGELITKLGVRQISTSTPIMDDEGNVILVLTTGKMAEYTDKAINAEEKENAKRRKREIEYLRSYVLDKDTIVAESKAMKQLLLQAHVVAQTDGTVVLYGESGTGKEILAKYLHRHSKRSGEAFIAVNCATLPEHLAESELFGYEKGAFTGANAEGKVGLFEAAHRGTLFLDEIAEMPLPLQAKLLRVLETYEIRRLGSCVDRKLDFRLICATHKDLQKMTQEGTFRADLFYRLNVIPIQIPPLRERPEDIVALAFKFFEDFKRKYGLEMRMTPDTIEFLQKHNWPGNVRELRNAIERLIINNMQGCTLEQLEIERHLPGSVPQCNYVLTHGMHGTLKEVTKFVEKQYIYQVLNECGGKMGEAAEKLGIYRTVLYRKLKAYEQEKADER
ncbi:Anaerobic nitric oxide reductase transcription regulator NorR [Sporomusa acidovorans DSM 3132]|uniref:Anaerobic nitric oxide reductase transcription regulator NorR n=1 Tax=Sporomusa acidovorans (strain ATCC 49682 / DSM 3132 / Mol) TaxID=1123286 RepID=A0ABZ3JB01_SPOA4|nr:sigma 54-interacting transcriptional regulator [Sporomusa acidovorans]OZC21702.1 limonene hydroxylase [Sporomusa acidovorans DSM 3132]SDD59704.1 Transcriptional regulator containing PAS, AAA-type ATPase, and DNA-binding Fis domains [Sporomusa acidovorans]